jgi:hypothetical protein
VLIGQIGFELEPPWAKWELQPTYAAHERAAVIIAAWLGGVS